MPGKPSHREMELKIQGLEQKVRELEQALSKAQPPDDMTNKSKNTSSEFAHFSEHNWQWITKNLGNEYFLYSHNTKGVFTFLSSSLKDVLGYSPDEFQTDFDKFLSDNPLNKEVILKTMKSIEGEKQEPYLLEIYHKSGDLIWLEVFEQPVFDDNGKVISVEGIAHNITRRIQGEKKLRESEEKLRNILENSTNIFYSHNLENQVTYISPQVFEIGGYTPDEVAENWTSFAADSPVNEIGHLRTVAAIETGEAQAPYELLFYHKNGQEVWVEVREAPIVVDGKTVALVGSLTDITKRKEAELISEKSRKKFSEILESTRDIHYREDFQTSVVDYFSPSVQDILGYTSSEMLEMDTNDQLTLFHPEDLPLLMNFKKDLLAMDIQKNKFLERTFRMIDKSGGIHWINGQYTLTRKADGSPNHIVGSLSDITQRKLDEQKLLQSEKELDEIFEVSPVGIAVVDLEGNITKLNRKFTEMFGYTLEEIPTIEICFATIYPDELYHEEIVDRWYKAVAEANKTKLEISPQELTVRCKDGSTIILEAKIKTSLAGILVTHVDITERKRIENNYRKSKEKFQEILENTRDLHYRRHVDTGILDYFSPSAMDILGYTAEEMKNIDFLDLVFFEDVSSVRKFRNELLRSKTKKFSELEYRIVDKFGEIHWLDAHYTLTRKEDGSPNFLVGAVRDITERKKTEQALKDSAAKYQTLFEATSDAILLFDEDGIIDCNDAALQLYAFDFKEQLLGLMPSELSPKNQKNGQNSIVLGNIYIEMAFLVGEQHFQWLHQSRDGNVFPADVLLTAMEIEGTSLLQAVIRDISEQERVQQQLTQRHEQLQLVLQGSRLGWWDWDIPSGEEQYNAILPELLGYELDEIAPHITWWENKIHPDDAKQVRDELAEHFAGKTEFYVNEHRLQTKTGEWLWFLDHGQVVERDEDGKALRMIGTLRDITARKQAEEMLERSEQKYRKLFEISNDANFLVHPTKGIFDSNDRGLEMFGVKTKEELCGLSIADISPELQGDGSTTSEKMNEIRNELKTKGAHYTLWTHKRDNGEEFPCTVQISTVKLGDEVIYHAVVRDITHQKQAEDKIRESEEKFREIIENTIDIHYRMYFDTGAYDYISPSVESILGFTPHEMMNFDFSENMKLFHPDDIFKLINFREELIEQDLKDNGFLEREFRTITKGGKICWIRGHYTLTRDNEGKPKFVIGILSDVTHQKDIEKKLKNNEEKFLKIIENTTAILYRQDFVTMKFQYISPSAASLFGHSVQEMLEMSVDEHFKLFHPEDLIKLKSFGDDLVDADNKNQLLEREFRMIDKSGTIHWIHGQYSLIKNSKGQPKYIIGVLTDFSDRKKAEIRVFKDLKNPPS